MFWEWASFIVLVWITVYVTSLYIRVRNMRHEVKHLLQATAWNITRIMGFLPIKGHKDDRDRREQLAREFIVGALHSLPENPKALVTQNLPGPDSVINAGFKLMDRNEKKTSEHIYMVATVRLGVQAFLFLIENGNIDAAYSSMIELMKWQRDEFDNKGSKNIINFTDLKKVLGLPTGVPSGTLPEQLSEHHVPFWRKAAIMSAIDGNREYFFKGIRYKGPDDREYLDYEVLVAMQKYAG